MCPVYSSDSFPDPGHIHETILLGFSLLQSDGFPAIKDE